MSGLNHYAYANSNPIRYIDPTGLVTEEEAQEQWNNEGCPGSFEDWCGDINGTPISEECEDVPDNTPWDENDPDYKYNPFPKAMWEARQFWANWEDKMQDEATKTAITVNMKWAERGWGRAFDMDYSKSKGIEYDFSAFNTKAPPVGAPNNKETIQYEKWNALEISVFFDFQARNVDTGGNLRLGMAFVTFTNGIITFEQDFIIASNQSFGFGSNLGVSCTITNFTAHLPEGSTPEDVINSFKGNFDSGGISVPFYGCFGAGVSYTQGEDGVQKGLTIEGSISTGFSLSEIRTFYTPSDKPYKLK